MEPCQGRGIRIPAPIRTAVFVAITLVPGCALLFPPHVSVFGLQPTQPSSLEIDSTFRGTIWVEDFDNTGEFNTDRFVYRFPGTSAVSASRHHAWPGFASDVARDFVARNLSERFSGHVQEAMTPPADYLIEATVEDMSIVCDADRKMIRASFELSYQISRKTGTSYQCSATGCDTASVAITRQDAASAAGAMADAIMTVSRHIGDRLVADSRH